MGMGISLLMMVSLHLVTWEVFLIWLALGLIIYFTYSRKHSRVQRALQEKAVAGD
jgi:APA family basic amino acid/polyamine antiporter